MPREGWIHVVAFLAVLGVGVLLIAPRLGGRPQDAPLPADGSYLPEPEEPKEAGPAVQAFEAQPEYDWLRVRVTGEGGPLRGPIRPVDGADVEARTPPEAPVQMLRIRPRGPRVSFGASGHQWRTFTTGDLEQRGRDGEAHIELPVAAAPLVIRVREADGRPAPDVPLHVVPAAPGPLPRTDEGGTLVLDHLPVGLVLVDAATSERRGPSLRLRAGTDRDVRLRLEPAWRVRGRVVDRMGKPLAGARVEGLGPAGSVGRIVTTGVAGAFEWTGPALVRIALRIRAPRLAETSIEATPPAVGDLVTDVGDVLLSGPGVTLVGTVQTSHLEPGAHVIVEPAVAAPLRELFGEGQVLDRPRRAELAADGTFRFHDLPPHLPLRVSVRGAGVPVDAIVEGKPGEEIPVELVPSDGEKFVGRVRHPDGRPAVGVRMLLSEVARDGDSPQPGDIEVVTGADGSFSRRGLGARTYFLRAYVPGRRSLLQRVTLPLADPLELTFGQAEPDATHRIHGHIHDGIRTDVKTKGDDPMVGEATDVSYGRPLAGVTVQAGGLRAVTDAEGGFELDGVESLAPVVGLSYGYVPGETTSEDPRPFLPSEALDVKPGGEALQLVLWRGATLRFRVLDAIDDRPLAFVHVVVRTDRGRLVVDRGIAPTDGVVELTALPPRGVELTLAARDRRLRRAPIPLRPGDTVDLGDVLMRHGLRVEGRVVDRHGRPVPGARIGTFGRGWQHAGHDPGAERELLFRTAVADADGRFAVEGFDPLRPPVLAVWARGYAPTCLSVDRPAPGQVAIKGLEVSLVAGGYLALDLYEVGSLRGRGARVHGAQLDLEHGNDGADWLDLLHRGLMGGPLGDAGRLREASAQLLHERRGPEGYVLGPVRPGPYTLWIERPGYEPLRRKLTIIDPGGTVRGAIDDRDEGVTGIEAHIRGRATRIELEIDRRRR